MRVTITAALAAASILALAGCRQAATTGNASENAAAPASAEAAAIDGTWKADLSSVQIDQKPDQLLLKDGQFSCPTCTPPIALAADGAMHAVERPYSDHMAVKADDDHNVTRTSQKAGKDTGTTKYSVSADGKTLTVSFSDSSVPNAKPVTGNYTETRVADAPAGAHAISGSWKLDKYNNVSDEGLTVSYRTDADTVHMSSPVGTSFDARLDGSEAPIKGDVAGTTASVKKLADGSYEETDKRGGKVISVTTFKAGSDGKMHVVSEDKLAGSTIRYTADKQ
jgi:hypothetical protein